MHTSNIHERKRMACAPHTCSARIQILTNFGAVNVRWSVGVCRPRTIVASRFEHKKKKNTKFLLRLVVVCIIGEYGGGHQLSLLFGWTNRADSNSKTIQWNISDRRACTWIGIVGSEHNNYSGDEAPINYSPVFGFYSQIRTTDKYPQSICKPCAEKLIEFHIFRQMILESEDRFRLTEELMSSEQIQTNYDTTLNGEKTFVTETTEYQIDLITKNNNDIACDNSHSHQSALMGDSQTCLNLENIQPSLIIQSDDVEMTKDHLIPAGSMESATIDHMVENIENYLGSSLSENFERICQSILDDEVFTGDVDSAQAITSNGATVNDTATSTLDSTAATYLHNGVVAKIRQPTITLADIIKTDRRSPILTEATSKRQVQLDWPRQRIYQCDQCELSFKLSSTFLRHYRHIHMNTAERKKCPHCPRIFKCRTGEGRHE